jgi:hypothetical protein
MRTVLEGHLRKSAEETHSGLVDGEAVAHAGMMRRYGLDHQRGDPFLALDSEVRIGFGSTRERGDFEAELLGRLGPGMRGGLPRKLDALGMLPGGDVALVEIKAEGGGLDRAAAQVAAHVFAFGMLAQQAQYDLGAVLSLLARQKAAVGLLPPGTTVANGAPGIVPVIAAPDAKGDWLERWEDELSPACNAHPELLRGLKLWRLSPEGEVLEERIP